MFVTNTIRSPGVAYSWIQHTLPEYSISNANIAKILRLHMAKPGWKKIWILVPYADLKLETHDENGHYPLEIQERHSRLH